jgi:hypothetical protein
LEKYQKGTQPKFNPDIEEQMNVITIEKKNIYIGKETIRMKNDRKYISNH